MKVIIIAAGFSSRLRPLTEDRPKCLVNVGGKSILEYQLDAFHSQGMRDIALIKGYRGEKINTPTLKYYFNNDYKNNNILCSLMCAEEAMTSEFIATYSDIIFSGDIIKKLMDDKNPITIVVDTDWKEYYIGRTSHSPEEAENVVFDQDRSIVQIGKYVSEKDIIAGYGFGEFIGMMKCSDDGARIFREYFHKAKNEFSGKPFVQAALFEKAYLTDFLQYLCMHGVPINCVLIKKGWYEIDTVQDLEKVTGLLQKSKINV